MPRANRQNNNVARFNNHLAPAWTSDQEARAACGKSQNLCAVE
jgi:hypothetical protein